MSVQCQFCLKYSSNKSNLKKHQKTAKHCLKIQSEHNIVSEEIMYTCDYCDKQFTSKCNLNYHSERCIEKSNKIIDDLRKELEEKNKIINEYQEKVKELENKIHVVKLETQNEMLEKETQDLKNTVNEIAKQPKIQNNKIMIMTPLDLSKEGIKNAIETNFSHDHLTLGQKGVAQFAYNNILKDEQGKLMYVCTDPSRQIFQYKSNDGKIQKDVRATKLTKAILDSEIKQTSHKIAWDNMKDGDNEIFMQYTNFYQDIQDLEVDNTDFRKELSSLTVK